MKVPISWLKDYVGFDLSPEEIATKLTMGGLEVEGIEQSDVGPVLDVYITPNRGDCLSIKGVAREVAALLGEPLKVVGNSFADEPGPGQNSLAGISVEITDSALCPRYSARIVDNIKIGPSPSWLSQRLEAAGQRSVNNVVDVTNYVMLELGLPVHAFDAAKLTGNRIIVRQAKSGEKITTLDEVSRELMPPMLVIADAEGAVAVAGIMGGLNSEVTDATTRILIESAHFSPLSVRRTSRGLNLKSEASYRFERVVDPGATVEAANRCCELLNRLGISGAITGCIDVLPNPIENRRIGLRVSRTSQRLGMQLTSENCKECLEALGFEVTTKADADQLQVSVPTYRADISIEEDLIEEVGRIYGYENIPETLPLGETTRGGDSALGSFLTRIRHVLVECGMQEVVTHSLTAPAFFDRPEDSLRRVEIRNALSTNISGLRSSLIPTLIDTAQNNAARGQQNLALFELGRIWQSEPNQSDEAPVAVEYVACAGLMTGSHLGSGSNAGWKSGGKLEPADYYALKGVVDRLFSGLDIPNFTLRSASERADWLPQFHPGRAATISLGGGRPDGVIGELHPAIAARLNIKHRIYLFEISVDSLQKAGTTSLKRYQSISRQQAVLRDIAPRIDETVSYASIVSAISAASITILKDVRLSEIYRGAPLAANQKSLTIGLTFAASSTGTDDRAVSEVEVTEALNSIRKELEERCGASFVG